MTIEGSRAPSPIAEPARVPAGPAAPRQRQPSQGRWRDLLGAVLALAVFVVLFALVAPRQPQAWEPEVVDAAVGLPEVIGMPLRLVMQLGRRLLVPVVGLAVLVVGRRLRPAVATLVAGLAAAETINLLKQWASRPRPIGVRVREAADGFGFPSGHSAIAWAVAVVIATQLPARWRWVPFSVAATVAVARVHAGVHHPLDIVGGAIWGLAVGGVVVATADLRPGRRRALG